MARQEPLGVLLQGGQPDFPQSWPVILGEHFHPEVGRFAGHGTDVPRLRTLTTPATRIVAVRPARVHNDRSRGSLSRRLWHVTALKEQCRYLRERIRAQAESGSRGLLVHDGQGVPAPWSGEANGVGDPDATVVLPAVFVPGAVAGPGAPHAPF